MWYRKSCDFIKLCGRTSYRCVLYFHTYMISMLFLLAWTMNAKITLHIFPCKWIAATYKIALSFFCDFYLNTRLHSLQTHTLLFFVSYAMYLINTIYIMLRTQILSLLHCSFYLLLWMHIFYVICILVYSTWEQMDIFFNPALPYIRYFPAISLFVNSWENCNEKSKTNFRLSIWNLVQFDKKNKKELIFIPLLIIFHVI